MGPLCCSRLLPTLEDARDEDIFQLEPNETPLWEQVKIKALFNNDISPRTVINDLKTLLNHPDPINYRIEKVADEDWVRITQQHFKPQCYADKLWICPSWHDEPVTGDIVKIDPARLGGTFLEFPTFPHVFFYVSYIFLIFLYAFPYFPPLSRPH